MAVDRWNNKELRTLLQTVARYQSRGRRITDAFEKVAEKLDRSKDTVQAKYYSLFQSVTKDQREELLQRYYDGDITFTALMAVLQGKPEPPRGGRQPSWTKKERAILFAEVYKALIDGETKKAAFTRASERTQRTHSACAVRFSNEMADAGNPDDEAEFLRNWLIDAGLSLSPEGDDTSQEVEKALQRWLNQSDERSPETEIPVEDEAEFDDNDDDVAHLQAQILSLAQRMKRLESRLDQISAQLSTPQRAFSTSALDERTLREIQEQLESLSRILSSYLAHDDQNQPAAVN